MKRFFLKPILIIFACVSVTNTMNRAVYAQEISESLSIGKVIHLKSKYVNEERRIIVHLPKNYEKENNAYPVLYILDADWTEYFTLAVGTAGMMVVHGAYSQFIVVGICNTVRDRDMIPIPVSHRENSGGSSDFLKFITEELMVFVNSRYRTLSFNTLYGGSNAGLFTLYAMLEKPDAFQAYIASSPMIGHCTEFIYEKTDEFLQEKHFSGKILYIVYGRYDVDRAKNSIPDYVTYLKQHASDRLLMNMKCIEDDGHVPYAGLFYGLRFISSQLEIPSK